MTNGIGGNTQEQALATLQDMTQDAQSIHQSEFAQRIRRAQQHMRETNIAAVYLDAGTNLTYFTGLQWSPSERLVGAILPAKGELVYLAPTFEIASLKERQVIDGHFASWEEHESPYALFADQAMKAGCQPGDRIGIDESAAFFIADGISQAMPKSVMVNASSVTAYCRMRKSSAEIALIQRAMDMTLAVHKATASILYEGITTLEVEQFINRAHKKVGASGSFFCIVLFGKATSFPHGVKDPQTLKANDLVLIDTGCRLHGYLSDITRTYSFGVPSNRQKQMWQAEKNAQLAAFNAAMPGNTCGDVDAAARAYLASCGLGPGYALPGCPHRTGHGIGLDIHEWPYLVKDNSQVLASGMCFSNEPMLVVPDEFGVRLEDHFYVTDTGPKWFTQPATSIDNPFG